MKIKRSGSEASPLRAAKTTERGRTVYLRKAIRRRLCIVLISFILFVVSLLTPGYFALYGIPEKTASTVSLVIGICFIILAIIGIFGVIKNTRELVWPREEREQEKKREAEAEAEFENDIKATIEEVLYSEMEDKLENEIEGELEKELGDAFPDIPSDEGEAITEEAPMNEENTVV